VTDKEFTRIISDVLDALYPELHFVLERVPIIVDTYADDSVVNAFGNRPIYAAFLTMDRNCVPHIRLYKDDILNHPKAYNMKKLLRDIILHEVGHIYGLSCECISMRFGK